MYNLTLFMIFLFSHQSKHADTSRIYQDFSSKCTVFVVFVFVCFCFVVFYLFVCLGGGGVWVFFKVTLLLEGRQDNFHTMFFS